MKPSAQGLRPLAARAASFPCRETDAKLGNSPQLGDWGTGRVGEAPSHLDSYPLCPPGPNLQRPPQPGMGNGVKEGTVRLHKDAEAVLPSAVSSKASTRPPHGRAHRSVSCGRTPVTEEHLPSLSINPHPGPGLRDDSSLSVEALLGSERVVLGPGARVLTGHGPQGGRALPALSDDRPCNDVFLAERSQASSQLPPVRGCGRRSC